MANDGTLRVMARIGALEYLIKHLLFMAANSKANPVEEIAAYRSRVLDELRSSTIPSSDPATSDMLVQYLEEAVDGLLQDLQAKMNSTEDGE